MNNRKNYPVRPLGKYGHTYYLSPKGYMFYRVYISVYSIIVLSLASFHFFVPKFSKIIAGTPDNLPIVCALIFSIFGLLLGLNIISSNPKCSEEEDNSSDKIIKNKSSLWRINKLFTILIYSLFLLALFVLFIFGAIQQGIFDYKLFIIIMIFLLLFIVFLYRVRDI